MGWYVHHHGRGHLTRLLAIAPWLDAEITCFSTLPPPSDLPQRCRWVSLDRDDDVEGAGDPRLADPDAGGVLHWAPLRHSGHRRRLAAIASWIASDAPDVFVVDVSVEVTLLVRLLGVPIALMTQPGRRDDLPHRLGFDAASTIIAPWPAELLAPDHLAPHRAKTVFTGGVSRFELRSRGAASADPGRSHGVVLLGGAGGSDLSPERLAATVQASDREWTLLGSEATGDWSADPWETIEDAGIVVSWAGQNAVADLAAADARSIIVPQDRPFAEQREMAAALGRAGLADVVDAWPDDASWPALLERAGTREPDWSRWQIQGAGARAAAAILETAARR